MAKLKRPPNNPVLGKMVRKWGMQRGWRMYFSRANDPNVHGQFSTKKPTKRSK